MINNTDEFISYNQMDNQNKTKHWEKENIINIRNERHHSRSQILKR